ncbi:MULTISPECIES: DUF309 domain-containing protein [unclassified Sulfuricurvum]|uniref:DUF309 domain-containing protein n=1 Tax=unclassified Sulfuricurvum TaxID=2632390 RepID=UPI000AA141C0|nr:MULTISPECIES: DUF309 domain-containing protein [unclassified Sulfuricurvum]
MAQEFEGIAEALGAFAVSLQEGRYYDAHEEIERLWYPRRFDDDDEVRLWKGLINAAVAFELTRRGRPKPSETAWKTYLKYRPLNDTLVTVHKELYVRIMNLIERQRGKLCPSS